MVNTHPLETIPSPKTDEFYSVLREHLDVAARMCAEGSRDDRAWAAVSCELSAIAEFCAAADVYNYALSEAEGDETVPRTRRCWMADEAWYGVRPHAWARSLAELKRGVVNAVKRGVSDPAVLEAAPPPGVPSSEVEKAVRQLKRAGVLVEGLDGRLVIAPTTKGGLR